MDLVLDLQTIEPELHHDGHEPEPSNLSIILCV